jgi:hypothetical protein
MFPSAGKLRVKAGRTMVALSAGKGIASFCRKAGKAGAKRGKIIAAVVLPGLQGKGLCAKKPIC